MTIEIKVNNVDACYDLVDVSSDQPHDRKLLAKVYDRANAAKIANLLGGSEPFQCHNSED